MAERILSADQQDEAEWRTAARSSYYAVYHVCARHFGLDPSKPGAKHDVIRSLLKGIRRTSQTPTFVMVAQDCIGSLWRLRVRADYYLDEPFTGDEADQALGYAQRVMAGIR